jgi:hypothetical protein
MTYTLVGAAGRAHRSVSPAYRLNCGELAVP